MLIKNLMTRDVKTISIKKPFTEACRMFNSYKIHHLPVVDNNNILLGLISFKDAMKVFHEKIYYSQKIKEAGINKKIKIYDVMTKENLHTLKPNDKLKKAVILFKKYDISSIPIAEDGKLVGILTTNDISKQLAN